MALQTINRISKAGIADSASVYVAAESGGDSVIASGGLLIEMSNGDGSPHTLTVAAPSASANCGNLGALDVDPLTLVVAAGDVGKLVIPAGYANSSAQFDWTYDAVTSVNIAVYTLQP